MFKDKMSYEQGIMKLLKSGNSSLNKSKDICWLIVINLLCWIKYSSFKKKLPSKILKLHRILKYTHIEEKNRKTEKYKLIYSDSEIQPLTGSFEIRDTNSTNITAADSLLNIFTAFNSNVRFVKHSSFCVQQAMYRFIRKQFYIHALKLASVDWILTVPCQKKKNYKSCLPFKWFAWVCNFVNPLVSSFLIIFFIET